MEHDTQGTGYAGIYTCYLGNAGYLYVVYAGFIGTQIIHSKHIMSCSLCRVCGVCNEQRQHTVVITAHYLMVLLYFKTNVAN